MLNVACKQVVLLLVFNLVYGQDEDCFHTKTKSSGVCTPLKDCKSAVHVLNTGSIPQTCRFDDGYPIVCCPLESSTDSLLPVPSRINVGKSDQKCDEYSTKLRSVVKKGVQINIIGGKNASEGEFPHMASLGYGDPADIQWKCGGCLISERYVLTAAHCRRSDEGGDVKYVQLGALVLSGPSRTRQNFLVSEIINHPQYEAPSTYNDIALLKLDKDVTFTPYVKPACLYTAPDFKERKFTFEVTGWGLTEYGGSASEVLQRVDLELFDDCTSKFSVNKRKLAQGILSDSQICFGSRNESKDACTGDSGGPLQVFFYNKLLHSIVGVTSFGTACGTPGFPGVYTRVSHYVPWIESIIWK